MLMKLIASLCLTFGVIASALCATAPEKPNLIFIIADDLGYGDLGCYGQTRIRTPNIDLLAAQGMRFTQHYAGNAVCAPSRCVLMTGKHPGRAYVRNNREVQPEGQVPLPADTVTLPKLLQKHGYATGAFGKWGLGSPGSTGDPLHQGFDRFFGYNCQRAAHNYYPTNLWDDDRRIPLNNPYFPAHQKLPPDADPKDPASYQRYSGQDYAPDLIAAQARQFLRANSHRPFFLFFPTTVPHLALQVPEDSLDEYRRQWPEQPYPGGNGYLPQLAPRAAYAAMITRLDREVGRLASLVKELGIEERTIFIFTSDNGPLAGRFGGTDSDFFHSAGSLRGRKGSLFEGGIRVPLVVRWAGHVAPGSTSDRISGFEDWLPTILELTGAPEAQTGSIDGISFAPALRNQHQEPRPFLYREFSGNGGQQSVRVGNWKGIREALSRPRNPDAHGLKLFDLAKDSFGNH